jgi:hypothetical protein
MEGCLFLAAPLSSAGHCVCRRSMCAPARPRRSCGVMRITRGSPGVRRSAYCLDGRRQGDPREYAPDDLRRDVHSRHLHHYRVCGGPGDEHASGSRPGGGEGARHDHPSHRVPRRESFVRQPGHLVSVRVRMLDDRFADRLDGSAQTERREPCSNEPGVAPKPDSGDRHQRARDGGRRSVGQVAPVAHVQRLQVCVAEAVDRSQRALLHCGAKGGERDEQCGRARPPSRRSGCHPTKRPGSGSPAAACRPRARAW